MYKILFLICVCDRGIIHRQRAPLILTTFHQIAVVSTTPWDSYLIHNRIWTYPPEAILGPTFLKIPVEEIFFFVIQTYNTSLLYLLISKPTFHPVYLQTERDVQNRRLLPWEKWLGQAILSFVIVIGVILVSRGGQGLYMGLILAWAVPFMLILWSLAYQFLLGLPLSNTAIPVVLPTFYLWAVDTLALKRGTWVIESRTKLGLNLWDGLEIEEAVFFLVTNVLIVFGLVAFNNALAVLETFTTKFPDLPSMPSPLLLVEALLLPSHKYDQLKIYGLQEALYRLRKKSRSFYLASGVFEGRLRIDLIILYSFCRVADDLVDDAASLAEAKGWIEQLNMYLDMVYRNKSSNRSGVTDFVFDVFPPSAQRTLVLLPTAYLSAEPLYELVKGFETDLDFSSEIHGSFPINTQEDLQLYGSRVAGTVAESCIELVYHHTHADSAPEQRRRVLEAGGKMGIALQCVNIARDITVDAHMSRVYLPSSWLKDANLTPTAVIHDPTHSAIEGLRSRLLDLAFVIYEEARDAIEELPAEARAPMRVAVESYMEIGRVLGEQGYMVKDGRATVPKSRRLRVAWKALNQ